MYDRYKDAINYDALLETLNMLSSITGLRINFYTKGNKWISTTATKKSAFCEIIKVSCQGNRACECSDSQAAEVVKQQPLPYIYRCHLGLSEGIVPVFFSDNYIGCYIFGQVLSTPPSSAHWDWIAAQVKDWDHLPLDSLRDAYFRLGCIEEEKLQNLAKLLQFIAKHTVEMEIVRLAHHDLLSRVQTYIEANYNREIPLKEIAAYVYLNPSYLSFIFKKEKGVSITDYIMKYRVEKAKEMLLTTNMSIGEIAEKIGYNEQNYFTRIFRKMVGEAPTAFRKTPK